MAEVISFRFKTHEMEHISKLSEEQRLDRTNAARTLIEYGWVYYVLTQYKLGKLSTENTAKQLHISISELIDLLADLGIKSPVSYEDYLESLKNL